MGLLCGRAGRLTAENGGSRRGQIAIGAHTADLATLATPVVHPVIVFVRADAAAGRTPPGSGGAAASWAPRGAAVRVARVLVSAMAPVFVGGYL
jgi:hypothetical protein